MYFAEGKIRIEFCRGYAAGEDRPLRGQGMPLKGSCEQMTNLAKGLLLDFRSEMMSGAYRCRGR